MFLLMTSRSSFHFGHLPLVFRFLSGSGRLMRNRVYKGSSDTLALYLTSYRPSRILMYFFIKPGDNILFLQKNNHIVICYVSDIFFFQRVPIQSEIGVCSRNIGMKMDPDCFQTLPQLSQKTISTHL